MSRCLPDTTKKTTWNTVAIMRILDNSNIRNMVYNRYEIRKLEQRCVTLPEEEWKRVELPSADYFKEGIFENCKLRKAIQRALLMENVMQGIVL